MNDLLRLPPPFDQNFFYNPLPLIPSDNNIDPPSDDEDEETLPDWPNISFGD